MRDIRNIGIFIPEKKLLTFARKIIMYKGWSKSSSLFEFPAFYLVKLYCPGQVIDFVTFGQVRRQWSLCAYLALFLQKGRIIQIEYKLEKNCIGARP